MLFVKKADGTTQPYERAKIINTCLRLRASRETAETIADKIENQLYDGIPTKKILQLIFKYLTDSPAVKHQIDLRKAISLLRPQPDFEQFIRMLLEEYGYTVSDSQIVQGKCVEHEIDAIAYRGDDTYFVEIKHHRNHHSYTGLDIPRIAQATFEDIADGFRLNLNSIHFTKALIVCNTKFSEHATQYAKCKGIDLIGWKTPPNHGLELIIDEKKLLPISILKQLDKRSMNKLMDNHIILLKQLIAADVDDLWKKIRIPKLQLKKVIKTAKEILTNY
ncbi:MAG: restriction endonuclease [Candidatus Hodarchaeota archaeon]